MCCEKYCSWKKHLEKKFSGKMASQTWPYCTWISNVLFTAQMHTHRTKNTLAHLRKTVSECWASQIGKLQCTMACTNYWLQASTHISNTIYMWNCKSGIIETHKFAFLKHTKYSKSKVHQALLTSVQLVTFWKKEKLSVAKWTHIKQVLPC